MISKTSNGSDRTISTMDERVVMWCYERHLIKRVPSHRNLLGKNKKQERERQGKEPIVIIILY